MRWIALCLLIFQAHSALSDPYHLHDMYGTFSSPNFPETYANNLILNWTIRVSKGFRVALYFSAFDLEDSIAGGQPCSADYVKIFDGGLDSNTTSRRFCGNNDLYSDDAPSLFTYIYRSTANSITVQFASDYSNDLPGSPPPKGFKAIYKAEDINECEELEKKFLTATYPEQVGKCDHYCHNFLGTYQCSCKSGYELADNGYTCKGKCSGQRVFARAGIITSPGYPVKYPKKTDCDWTIEADIGQRIQLDFNGIFEVENYTTSECPYDWVKIIDEEKVIKYCGSGPQGSIISNGNVVRIEFHSDMVKEMAGFSVSHRLRGIYCEQPVPPTHGHVLEAYGAENGRLPYDSVVVFECEIDYEILSLIHI